MTFKLYKTHKAPDKTLGYTYNELYSKVVKEWNLKPIPDIGAMSREASNIIKNYLIKEGIIEHIIDKRGHSRYIPKVTRTITKPIKLGTDVSTGFNVYSIPDERKFAVMDEDWNVIPSGKRYLRITISTTFSLDTSGGNQRLKFYEATAFITIPYSKDITPTTITDYGEELRDFIKSALSHYFNPGVAEASEIKIGVEIMTSPPIESLNTPKVYIEYGHSDTKSGGYRVLEKTPADILGEPSPHKGFGRGHKQKTLFPEE